MNYFSISNLIIIAINLLSAIFLFISSKGRKSNIILGYLCLAAVIWGMGSYKYSITLSKESATFWWQIANIGSVFSTVMFYYFILSFLNIKKKTLSFIVNVITGFYLFLNFFVKEAFIGDLEFIFDQFYYISWPIDKITLYLIYYLFFYFILLFYSFVLLIKRFITSSGIYRQQMKYLIVGMVTGFVGCHACFIPVFGFKSYPYLSIFIAFYTLPITYAIIKYRLMDIRLAVTKAGVFLVVYVPVFGMPLFYMGYHLGLWEKATWAILILMIIGHYVHSYLQKQAENYLFAEQRRYQDILQKAARGINRIKELDKLLNLTIHILSRAMRLVSCSAYIYDSKSDQYILKAHRGLESHQLTNIVESKNHMITQLESSKFPIVLDEVKARVSIEKEGMLSEIVEAMESLNVEVVIPCISKVQPIAFMILGKKKSGKLYSESDLTTFSILSSQVALAIENCIYLQETGSDLSQKFQQQRLSGLGVLATGISHQLNNRFNAIVVNCGLSLKTEEKASVKNFSKKQVIEKFKECMKKIKSIALDAKSVTEAVQNYSKAKADAEVLMFDDIVNDAYGLVRLKHEGLQFEFVKEYSMDILIWAGRAALQDAIYNALDNSCYAMKLKMKEIDDYRPRISIRGFVKGKMVRLEIEDNGKGIKEEDMKKLFTPLFTTKGHNEGTGLGLSVIMDLIQKNSGTIKMESTYGVGTKTIITIPHATKENKHKKENEC